MKMLRNLLVLCLGALLLAGCAVPSKTLDTGFWQEDHGRFGVVLVTPPAPSYIPLGAGLLDQAIIAAATKQVQARIATFSNGPLLGLPNQVAAALKARGKRVTVATQVPQSELARNPDSSVPQYDYSALARRFNVNTLVVIRMLPFGPGISRNYYGFIPLSTPHAYLRAEVVMVDNGKNKIFWSHPILLDRDVGADWDTPPDYTRLSDTYRDTLQAAAQEIAGALR